ncbi:excalibur calcium-binding domain-containing protein [Streptomyces chumphonensis]|uniref:Excalibur calcium-binding domain-containing protein n=2 Tax=Streptomyces chumphonensis TaxID=1214925 RepID=A0A927EYF1_9ACTN|nr:excalibur calcium-binding domain-containing protein [Streptomyces chumphonensis]
MKRAYAAGVLILLTGFACGSTAASEDATASADPAPTVTVTAAPTSTPTVTATPEPGPTVTEPGPTVTVTETATEEVAVPAEVPEAPETGTGGGDDAGAAAYYRNCDAARAAGAAPVYRGQPGYGGHLDRDGDGVGCE